jgi:hypothetical protein
MSVRERQAVFAALVKLQDRGKSIVESRELITRRFKISLNTLRAIEHEGILADWPPLDAEPATSALGK